MISIVVDVQADAKALKDGDVYHVTVKSTDNRVLSDRSWSVYPDHSAERSGVRADVRATEKDDRALVRRRFRSTIEIGELDGAKPHSAVRPRNRLHRRRRHSRVD